MSTLATANWHEANQRYLTAALAGVRGMLERHAARAQGTPAQEDGAADEAVRQAADAMPAPPALETLCATFGLSPFERAVLLACAGVELDSSFAALCATAQGDALRTYPTFSLALAALPGAHWTALTPAAPLRHWRLLEVGAGGALRGYPERSPAKPAIISRGRDNGTPDLVCRGPSDGAADEPR